MKKATCLQLRGACDYVVVGETALEMAENCREHAMDMIDDGDLAHIAAAQDMMSLSSKEQLAWFSDFEKTFESFEDAD